MLQPNRSKAFYFWNMVVSFSSHAWPFLPGLWTLYVHHVTTGWMPF